MEGAIADRARLGIELPQVFATAAGIVPDDLVAFAARAEELGADSLWTHEAYLTQAAVLDGLELLAFAAPVTERIGLGIAVLVLGRHDPVILAKRLATLDHLSGGRLIAGVGVGRGADGFGRTGSASGSAAARFEETLGLVDRLWARERVTHEGPQWRLEGAAMEPPPLQRPRPPVWFGGGHPRALARAARLGDGWMGGGASTADAFAQQVAVLREELAKRPGDEPFPISKRVFIAVGDPRRGREHLDAYLRGVYGPAGPPPEVAVVGDEEHCREQLERLVEAGANHLLLAPVHDDAEQLERLAELTGLGAARRSAV